MILTAEEMYFINFKENHKRSCSSLRYNGANTYIFVNPVEIYKLIEKDSEIKADPLCLANFSKDFSTDNMKKDWIVRICL